MKKNSSDPEDMIVLDCKNEDGVSVSDNSDDDEAEEGEMDMEGEGGEDDIYNDLEISSEMRDKIKNGTITEEEMNQLQMQAGIGSDYGEEGEEEDDKGGCCDNEDCDEPASKK